MREFVYYSQNAVTSGSFLSKKNLDLMAAGRMDIVCNVIIQTFFVSNNIRKDVRLHLVFDGPSNAPLHILLDSSKFEHGKEDSVSISKKNVVGLIRKLLYKAPRDNGKNIEVFNGCFVEKKSLEAVLKELDSEGKNVLLLDEKGDDVRDIELRGNEAFVLGDHEGFPASKRKFLKRIEKVSVGPRVLFASQVSVLINNELDRHNI